MAFFLHFIRGKNFVWSLRGYYVGEEDLYKQVIISCNYNLPFTKRINTL